MRINSVAGNALDQNDPGVRRVLVQPGLLQARAVTVGVSIWV